MTLARRVLAGIACAVLVLAPQRASAHEKVKWHDEWPRVRLVEGLNIVALTFGSYAIDRWWDPPRASWWAGPVLFDNAVRSVLKAPDFETASFFAKSSDKVYLTATFAPYLIDNYIVALGIHQSPDVALQMTLMNMQSLGITGVFALALERGLARARPYTRQCDSDGKTRDINGKELYNDCDFGGADYQSFPSGHAGATMTMAGLTCAHHQHMPLYGGGPVELIPCALMVTASLYTGMARIVADRHWATDVLTGWAVGAFSGYVLPTLLHYGWKNGPPLEIKGAAGARAYPIPQAFPNGAGLGLLGSF